MKYIDIVPDYKWTDQLPDPSKHYSIGGCYGCDFRRSNVRCSLIPCQNHPGKIAKIVATDNK